MPNWMTRRLGRSASASPHLTEDEANRHAKNKRTAKKKGRGRAATALAVGTALADLAAQVVRSEAGYEEPQDSLRMRSNSVPDLGYAHVSTEDEDQEALALVMGRPSQPPPPPLPTPRRKLSADSMRKDSGLGFGRPVHSSSLTSLNSLGDSPLGVLPSLQCSSCSEVSEYSDSDSDSESESEGVSDVYAEVRVHELPSLPSRRYKLDRKTKRQIKKNHKEVEEEERRTLEGKEGKSSPRLLRLFGRRRSSQETSGLSRHAVTANPTSSASAAYDRRPSTAPQLHSPAKSSATLTSNDFEGYQLVNPRLSMFEH
eukprot:m.353786 g.353786  ORF g.353786 m.353786 type:complete len:314 (+) comp16834_c0_seq1:605-1546(+)